MSDRKERLAFISRQLGCRELIWAGLRADDIHAISDLGQLAGSFSAIGGRDRDGLLPGVDFEDLSGRRVDLDNWDIEDHLETGPAQEFRHLILARLEVPSALLPYRSSKFLSSILFARRDRCLDLGLFGAHQQLFEYKPWVETYVAMLGLPHLRWEYVADEEQQRARRLLSEGPIMLRVSRSSGGAGIVRVDEPDHLAANWPHRPEAFVGVSRFIANATPVNVGATVWHDGVTVSHPSVQLVGIPECTTRPFGYCGNDFGLASALPNSTLDAMERSVFALGRWLHSYNYCGTFGVDFLVDESGVPLFSEINPRFQGSTHASSQLSGEANESCLFLDHIAARLGHDAPPSRPLREVAHNNPSFAHIVIQWTGKPTRVDSIRLSDALHALPACCRTDVLAKATVLTDTGGVALRVTTRASATSTGYDLHEPWRTTIASWAATHLGSLSGQVSGRPTYMNDESTACKRGGLHDD